MNHPLRADLIEISDGFTNIEVEPATIPLAPKFFSGEYPMGPATLVNPTGARVTLEFCRPAPIPPNNVIRARYDMAGNGAVREAVGTPQLTHTKSHSDGAVSYHYRLSYWIPARWIMRFL